MGLISDRDAGYDLRRPVGYDQGQRPPRRRPVHRGPVRRGGYRRRRRRTSVPVISIIAVAASIVVVAAALGANRLLSARSAASATVAANTNCTLIVPVNPLSAQGLATPYQLTATDPAAGPCNEANSAQTAFVQGAVIDPATGQVSVYDPLVIDLGTRPAIPPVVPTLPTGAVVAVWFGFNGDTLSLAGPDQVSVTPSQSASAPSQSASAPSQSASAPSQSASAPSQSASAPSQSAPAPSQSAPAPSQSPSGTPTGTAPAAATQAEGAVPLPAASVVQARYGATLTRLDQGGLAAGGHQGNGAHHHPAASASPPVASPPVTSSPSATAPMSAVPTGSGSAPPSAVADGPAASATPDAILQGANCVAGENTAAGFSPFTQVGACNAVAFWRAANAAVRAGRLRVPRPGIGADGMRCPTTRSFTLIDQDQSDNVTTEYLTGPDGQTAQDTAANRQAMGSQDTLFNGSDNGLLDSFVDPALGCTPWMAPDLADGGAPATALPLDELQAARWAGARGDPAALVPLNDPMTVDNNGQFSADKTNTYRSLMDMRPLPAGQSPGAYCRDMERIQGTRLQRDVNLLTRYASPAPDAADSLFTFLAVRLQQSFGNLNCGSFGALSNDVSTSVDSNGVVVAACFLRQVAPVTAGPGNPMAGTATCPAEAAAASSPGSGP